MTPSADFEDSARDLRRGIAKITIARPEVRNAFRPQTIVEISQALELAREDGSVGVIVLTGEGPLAFCSGGDQRVRGDTGYLADGDSVGRFHVTDLHVQIRRLPKPVVAMVAGYAVGGGTCCTSSATSPSPPTTPARPDRAGRLFDGGYGSGLLAAMWARRPGDLVLCRQYDARRR